MNSKEPSSFGESQDVQSMNEYIEVPFKHLVGTSLYEVRIQVGSNIYRVFSFFDKGDLVVLLHGITKKTQKTPKKEIDKALQLQKEYYDGKKK